MTAVEFIAQKLSKQIANNLFMELTFNKLLEQAKEMENKQMCNFAEFVATYPDKNENINGEMLHAKSKYDGAERTVDLLEIFKSE